MTLLLCKAPLGLACRLTPSPRTRKHWLEPKWNGARHNVETGYCAEQFDHAESQRSMAMR